KYYYNLRHKLIVFKEGNKVYLHLYKKYLILVEKNKKLDKQRVGLLKVLKKVSKYTYKLKVLEH
ncbi:hypothetical protein M430DRAFT_102614, partial [Amorphotheca resinae ATCC 22711]